MSDPALAVSVGMHSAGVRRRPYSSRRRSPTRGLRRAPIGRGAALVLAIALCGWPVSIARAVGAVGGAAAFELPAEHGFPQATYYRVTRLDPRLCPSPLCGGVFVERVNRRLARCAGGERARECHAAIVDFSALGLSPSEEAAARSDFVTRRMLVRGELELADPGVDIAVPTLVVEDAWRGVTGEQSEHGRYFGLFSSGIVCITHPCPSFVGFKLNGRRVGWLHQLDFDHTGATPAQLEEGWRALYQAPGLIGFGLLRTIRGPAGIGQALRMTEFYLPVVSSGAGGAPPVD